MAMKLQILGQNISTYKSMWIRNHYFFINCIKFSYKYFTLICTSSKNNNPYQELYTPNNNICNTYNQNLMFVV